MQKKILFAGILAGIVVISGILLPAKMQKQESSVCWQNHCFRVELAFTPVELRRGLMFREQLDMDSGMLFVYEEEEDRTFWMKNMFIPLDIIWIDSKNEVVFIKEHVQPCREDTCPSLRSDKNAQYVLEINSGMAQRISLNVGDRMEITVRR